MAVDSEGCKAVNIPLSTLHGRLNGAVSVKQNAVDRQLLSKVDEAWLARWILIQERLGQPPTHHQICHMATTTLQMSGGSEN